MKLVEHSKCVACELAREPAERAAVIAFCSGSLAAVHTSGPQELDALTRASFCAHHYALLAQTIRNARAIRDARGEMPS